MTRKCGEVAIGTIKSPDGEPRQLCEYHQGIAWAERDQSVEPWTLVRYSIYDRGGEFCEQEVADGETIKRRGPMCGVCGLALGVLLECRPIEITCPRCRQWVEWRS